MRDKLKENPRKSAEEIRQGRKGISLGRIHIQDLIHGGRCFDKCPICGGELIKKRVEKLLRGGTNTAILHIDAEVCLHCGERIYAEEDVKHFEEIRKKLERRETVSFEPVGQSFEVKF